MVRAPTERTLGTNLREMMKNHVDWRSGVLLMITQHNLGLVALRSLVSSVLVRHVWAEPSWMRIRGLPIIVATALV